MSSGIDYTVHHVVSGLGEEKCHVRKLRPHLRPAGVNYIFACHATKWAVLFPHHIVANAGYVHPVHIKKNRLPLLPCERGFKPSVPDPIRHNGWLCCVLLSEETTCGFCGLQGKDTLVNSCRVSRQVYPSDTRL